MDRVRFWAAVLLVALFAASSSGEAEENSCWPRSAEELQVSLSVVHALEDGPLVCQVKLRNVSKRRLDYAHGRGGLGASCRILADWKIKKEPLIRVGLAMGFVGPFRRPIMAGGTAETFYLHRSFLGVPAGDVPVRFGWDVYRTRKNTKKEGDSNGPSGPNETLQLLFSLKRTKTIKILPATKKNVARVLRVLETDFARVVQDAESLGDYSWRSPEPAYDFMQTLGGCRHKEFVPLLLRAMDRLPGSSCRSELVGTVYDSFPTPEEGFNALADYLASPRAAVAVEAFEYWKQEKDGHEESKRRQVKLRTKPKTDPAAKEVGLEELMWENLQSEEEAWRTSKRHADTRLTKEQFGRLRAMKNVWIRALLYVFFPEQCPADWVRALLTDLRWITHPPEQMRKLIAQLDDDRFKVREQATRKLIASRDAFAVYLIALPKDQLSLEASRRLREVLRGLSRTELPPLPRRVLSHLTWSDKSQARQLLDILRKSESANLITRKAQDAFRKRQNHEEKMKRLREGK